ncbi:hypothetical protein [Burkholderia mayonis]|uniref:hypothetical protein n=1 Tax=Burkholderia mayonis TaxID=1385591 RepID=UPI00131F1F44|nr:hypothetical protein [Burkholderia mayonis]
MVFKWYQSGIGLALDFAKKGWIERCGGWATRSAKAEGEDERREVAAAASERRRKKPAGEGRAKAEDGSNVDRRRGAPFIFRETGCERCAEIKALHRRGRQARRKRKRRPSGAPPLIRDGYARNRARSRTRQKQKALARGEGFVMRH